MRTYKSAAPPSDRKGHRLHNRHDNSGRVFNRSDVGDWVRAEFDGVLRGGIGMISETYNMDCMEYMKSLPDKAFDLAVVDPPYGGGGKTFKRSDKSRFGGRFDKYKRIKRKGGGWVAKYGQKIIEWDFAPSQEYFDELFRVSTNQIIWGANHFELPPCRCFLIWRKTNIPENFSMSQCEMAWTSFNDNAKIFSHTSQRNKKEFHFHPTEKPVALYAWIYNRYAKPGDKILDTHLGSGSSRIAAYDAGLDFVGLEIDKYYFDEQKKRFEAHTAQAKLDV